MKLDKPTLTAVASHTETTAHLGAGDANLSLNSAPAAPEESLTSPTWNYAILGTGASEETKSNMLPRIGDTAFPE